jgi:hypothetical protein
MAAARRARVVDDRRLPQRHADAAEHEAVRIDQELAQDDLIEVQLGEALAQPAVCQR